MPLGMIHKSSSHRVTAFLDENFHMKVTTSWHVTRLIELPSLSDSAVAGLRLLCVGGALKHYLNRALWFRKGTGSTQTLSLPL